MYQQSIQTQRQWIDLFVCRGDACFLLPPPCLSIVVILQWVSSLSKKQELVYNKYTMYSPYPRSYSGRASCCVNACWWIRLRKSLFIPPLKPWNPPCSDWYEMSSCGKNDELYNSSAELQLLKWLFSPHQVVILTPQNDHFFLQNGQSAKKCAVEIKYLAVNWFSLPTYKVGSIN